jgi:hypothetical protein
VGKCLTERLGGIGGFVFLTNPGRNSTHSKDNAEEINIITPVRPDGVSQLGHSNMKRAVDERVAAHEIQACSGIACPILTVYKCCHAQALADREDAVRNGKLAAIVSLRIRRQMGRSSLGTSTLVIGNTCKLEFCVFLLWA